MYALCDLYTEREFPEILSDTIESSGALEMRSFVWRNDTTGRTVAREINSRARRGNPTKIEKCRHGIWTEGVRWSLLHPERLPQELNHDGIQIMRLRRDDFDHSKVVISEDASLMMGMNLTDQTRDWMDFCVRSTDPDVRQALIDRKRPDFKISAAQQQGRPVVLTDHCEPRRWRMPDMMDEADVIGLPKRLETCLQSAGDETVRRSVDEIRSSHELMESLILTATDEVRICAVYLSLPSISAAVLHALSKGVRVRILSPKVIDVYYASIFEPLVRLQKMAEELGVADGLDIRFLDQMLHAKVVASNRGMYIGSSNPEELSAFVAGETGLYMPNESTVADRFIDVFERRFHQSQRIKEILITQRMLLTDRFKNSAKRKGIQMLHRMWHLRDQVSVKLLPLIAQLSRMTSMH